jgi:hypothetical protein
MFRKVLFGLAVLACLAVGATALGETWHGHLSYAHPGYHWSQPHYVPAPRVYVPAPRVYVVPQPYLYTYPSYYQPYLYSYPVYPSWGFSIQIGPRW